MPDGGMEVYARQRDGSVCQTKGWKCMTDGGIEVYARQREESVVYARLKDCNFDR